MRKAIVYLRKVKTGELIEEPTTSDELILLPLFTFQQESSVALLFHKKRYQPMIIRKEWRIFAQSILPN